MNNSNMELSLEMYKELKDTLVKAIKNTKAGKQGDGVRLDDTQVERIEQLIQTTECSQGQVAQLLEQLRKQMTLPGVQSQREQVIADKYNSLLKQLAGRLEVIDKDNQKIITETLCLKKSLSEFKNEVDTTKFEKLANNTLWEMKTQIRYLKHPPIVLRIIVFLTILSVLATLATGYLYKDRNEWKDEAVYWYKQSNQYKMTQTKKK